MGEELQYQRALAAAHRGPPATLRTPPTTQNPAAARRALEAARTTDSNRDADTISSNERAPKKNGVLVASSNNSSTELSWGLFWDGLTMSLKILFTTLLWTIIVPVAIAPLLFIVIVYRLIAVNLLNNGKPVRFPLLGIVDIMVTKIDLIKIPSSLGWLLACGIVFLIAACIVAILVYTMAKITGICTTLGPVCKLLPKLL